MSARRVGSALRRALDAFLRGFERARLRALLSGGLPRRNPGSSAEVMPELLVDRPERPEALAEWRVAALALIPDQVLRRGNFDVANRLLADGYVMHDLPSGRDVSGRGGYHAYMVVLRHAFPDLDIVVDSQSVAGDAITTRYHARGTFAGSYRGRAPNGKRVDVGGVLVSRFEGHVIAEEWNDYDRRAMRRQMG